MHKIQYDFEIQSSFLDLVTDDNPEIAQEAFWSSARQARAYMKAVVLDLERVLNSKCNVGYLLDTHADDLMLSYGVSDFTHTNVASLSGMEQLRMEIAKTIQANDPRLTDVYVTVVEQEEATKIVAFRIEARLLVHTDMEPLVLNASVETASRTIRVSSN